MSKHEFNVYGLPTHELPLFQEKPGREWVDYGYDNAYGDYLRDLYLGSSIQSAVVSGVSEMIYGEGLDATDREQKPDQWLKTQKLLENSDENILRQLCFDLKLYGQCYVQVIWNRVRTEIAELRFIPAHSVRSGVADAQGKVDCYYVSPDWSRMRESRYAPVKYPAWDMEDRTEPASVYQIKAYQPGIFYYGLPDYVGSTNYIELDREVSTFHLNNIKNGLFPSMLLSFNNGVPSDEERRAIERHVNEKFSGSSNAGRLLISFNDGTDSAPQLTPVNPNDNDGMYEFLATECTTKILAGHRITSPLLFGIRGDGNGFGNNADELRDSFSLFQNTVVQPFQRTLLDGLDPLFAVNGIDLDFYFKTLKPADFIDVDAVQAQTTDEQEKEGLEQELSAVDIPGSVADSLIEMGEDIEDDWELIDQREVNYESEVAMDAMWTFASVMEDNRDATSEDDSPIIKVRYYYAGDAPKSNSREFCRKMMQAGKFYRREDIEAQSGANPGFGEGGASNYDIWLYKGGPRCHHFWLRATFLKKDNKRVSVSQARQLINETIRNLPFSERDQYRIPTNDKRVAQQPNVMPRKGYSPNNPNLPSDV
jgi:hypothetical protein